MRPPPAELERRAVVYLRIPAAWIDAFNDVMIPNLQTISLRRGPDDPKQKLNLIEAVSIRSFAALFFSDQQTH